MKNNEKNKLIVKSYLRSKNICIVAKEFNLTKQRIHQVCLKMLGREKVSLIKGKRMKETVVKNRKNYIAKYGLKRFNLIKDIKRLKREAKLGLRWHWKYAACCGCGGTERKHHALGRCEICYLKFRYHSDPSYRERIRVWQKKYLSNPENMKNKKEKEAIWQHKRYLNDPDFRKKQKKVSNKSKCKV